MSKICKKCIYDENVSGISFDDKGICNYCAQIDLLSGHFKTGTAEGKANFEEIVESIKHAGRNRKYDVIVGVSGGTDSSYLLHLAVEMGLRPLAVHYDNTWNTAIATQNIKKIISKLNIDLETYVIDCEEQDEILLSFLKAGICGADAATDLALAEVMYRVANKHRIKYVFEGHSFQAEGVSPIGTSYTDGKFIASVIKQHSNKPIRTYPYMSLIAFLRWVLFLRIKKIRPLWYIPYSKSETKKMLEREYDWQDYGGHHLENRIAAFDHSFLMPQKFKVDQRNNSLSAAVRSGHMGRDEAIAEYKREPFCEEGLVDYVKKRLNLTDEDFEEIMDGPIRTFRDYKTYKKRFELLRPIFYLLAQFNLVPMSFYQKYCFPIPESID